MPQRFATLDEWLAWLETLHPKKIDFSLNRIRAVLDALGLATPPYRVITVGGTNGKGSCVAMLESIYLSAGYRVGAFTSPHLWRFNERLRLDGRMIADAELIELFERMEHARGTVTLSYFEASAVAAMLYFARAEVDVAILEVGMGGRLDAVNVYDADAALIVSVDLDHEEWLGKDRDSIGREKAGIMRAGRPAVVADPDPPRSVLEAAERIGVALRLVGRDYTVEVDGDAIVYRSGTLERRLPRPVFGVRAQVGNAAACVAVVESLQAALPVGDDAIREGLATARVAGRLDRHLVAGVEWIFDVAHNPAAAARMRDALDGQPAQGACFAVFGAMRDKDLSGVLHGFVAHVAHWFLAPVESERGASAEALEAVLAGLGARGASLHVDVAAACHAARERARPGDRVLVFGSFYTVGPAMAALGLYSPALFEG